MAVTTPTGHIRINPYTHMSEVWDGNTWIEMTNNVSVSQGAGGYGGGTVTANGSIASISTPATDIQKEQIFEFLKENLRVAEYMDEKNKIHTVQLEMRAGPGFVWENIKRVKTKNSL